jgi:GDP-4-dehydro-6-deoxy-D-mannose reductase
MHVLVTGVGGFIGPRLARLLVARGIRVTGTWLDSEPALAGVTLAQADLLEAPRLRALVAAAAPDAIVHLAGLSHVGESWQRLPEYFQANVIGTEHVLDAADATASRPLVLLASSAEVYGAVPAAEQPIAEARMPRPGTPYALTKAAAERLALRAGALVVRCFNLVGPGQASRFALPAFASQLAAIAGGRQEPVLRVGNLEARRDFVHVDDACEAFALLAERGERGGVYNVATGEAASMREALDLLCELSGVAAAVTVDPERLRPLDLPLQRGDATRLRTLGWEPRRGLRQAVEDLWAAVVADGAA